MGQSLVQLVSSGEHGYMLGAHWKRRIGLEVKIESPRLDIDKKDITRWRAMFESDMQNAHVFAVMAREYGKSAITCRRAWKRVEDSQ